MYTTDTNTKVLLLVLHVPTSSAAVVEKVLSLEFTEMWSRERSLLLRVRPYDDMLPYLSESVTATPIW